MIPRLEIPSVIEPESDPNMPEVRFYRSRSISARVVPAWQNKFAKEEKCNPTRGLTSSQLKESEQKLTGLRLLDSREEMEDQKSRLIDCESNSTENIYTKSKHHLFHISINQKSNYG